MFLFIRNIVRIVAADAQFFRVKYAEKKFLIMWNFVSIVAQKIQKVRCIRRI